MRISFWVSHCECVRVKVQVCASDFLQGNFVSRSSWLTSLVDLGVSRISVEIKIQTKKVRDKLYYHQCLLSFTRYKVPLRSCCKQIKVNTDTGLLDTVSCGNCIKCPAERPQTILKLVLKLVSVCSFSSVQYSIYSPFQTWTLYFNMINLFNMSVLVWMDTLVTFVSKATIFSYYFQHKFELNGIRLM